MRPKARAQDLADARRRWRSPRPGLAVGTRCALAQCRRGRTRRADRLGRPASQPAGRRHRLVRAVGRDRCATPPEAADARARIARRSRVTRSDSRAKADPAEEGRALAERRQHACPAPRTSPTRTRATIARALLLAVRLRRRPVRLPRLALGARVAAGASHADNPTSSAYGIPQALPGSKMASAGPDWADQPGHPDQVGSRLHPGPLRLTLRRLGSSQATAATDRPVAGHGRRPRRPYVAGVLARPAVERRGRSPARRPRCDERR